MKFELWCIGKTKSREVKALVDFYTKRTKPLQPLNVVEWPDPKKKKAGTKAADSEFILAKLNHDDWLILLDDKGSHYTSKKFSTYLEKRKMHSKKRNIFLVGGAYGFSEKVYARADDKLALSQMTLPHDLVRIFFVEQFYRASSILNNLPYHHE